ncbi:hypothetical protein DL766_007133 [Monosporascus sp. MC13-8B]|uniref:Heterokaryon incompatibility domain-containing protein n=1 Tax=Monosporascus cannonballus TaxID=155416 RepID=A0ABY0H0L0_9PEZI|nr:hypothetical protein DL762_006925 [Monosporascus cannonballus]RYO92438.1 hypothetical protein DL763_004665 [Monosporascus cannonballus]RYP25104.1 hypothetical protein DL766_007133 [Monosporascus sp. MC13-8B]
MSSSEAEYTSILNNLGVKQPQRPKPTGEKKNRLRIRAPPPRQDKERVRNNWYRIIRKARINLYRYDPIQKDYIRLMVLQPSLDRKADLHVSLLPVPITALDSCQYEALSYHWGESESENPVYVSSREHKGGEKMRDFSEVAVVAAARLYIKDNLYEALRHFRAEKHPILLWADGICMDQGNASELGAQIPHMAQIYSKADRVCIWLGTADIDRRTDRAMDFIGEVVKTHDIRDLIQADQAQNWRDLIFLVTCTWFSRRWIIQEIALAIEATVHCGSKVIDWRDFVDAISLFDLNFQDIRKLFADKSHEYNVITDLKPLGAKILVDELSNTFLRKANRTLFEPIKSLEVLVSTLAPFETSDPRDTIFALLNIAKETSSASAQRMIPDAQFSQPTPDYTKNLLEVYIEFLRWVIHTSNSLDIICRHWALPERKSKAIMYEVLVALPSWIKLVPESPYGQQSEGLNGRKNGDSFVGLPGAKCYNASHNMGPAVRFTTGLAKSPNSPMRSATKPTGNPQAIPMRERESGKRRYAVQNGAVPPKSPSSSPTSPIWKPFSQQESRVEQATLPISTDSSMYVKGFVLGTITWNTSRIPDGIIPQEALKKLGWIDEGEFEYYDVPDRVWRTLVADRGPDGKPPPSWYKRACLRCLVNDTPNGHIATKDILERSPPGIMQDYIKRVQAVTWNRVVFEAKNAGDTETGKLVGIGPPFTERDDLVCILFGCSVPVIIRPWVSFQRSTSQTDGRRKPKDKEKPSYYEFLGEAFVYGKMDGQAVSAMDPNQLEARTLEFRLM